MYTHVIVIILHSLTAVKLFERIRTLAVVYISCAN